MESSSIEKTLDINVSQSDFIIFKGQRIQLLITLSKLQLSKATI